MAKRIDTRVEQLEKLIGSSDIVGVRIGDDKTVQVTSTQEELEMEAFWSKYPDATLIHLVYKDTPPDKKIVVDWSDIDSSI